MAAYIIVEVDVEDFKAYEDYKKLVPASLAPFDGKFVVRGGKSTMLEGNWNPGRMVILEFPNVQKANDWWSSEIYSEAKEIRQRAAKTKMIIVEGV